MKKTEHRTSLLIFVKHRTNTRKQVIEHNEIIQIIKHKQTVWKEKNKHLSYAFDRDEDRLRLSDCEEQLRDWAKELVDREIERRPEGAKLKDLKDLKQKAIDNVMESGTPDELKQSLNLVVKHIGLTWNVDTSKIKQLAQS